MPKKPNQPSGDFNSVGSIMQGLFAEAGRNLPALPTSTEQKKPVPKRSRGEATNSKLAKAAAEIKAAPHKVDAAYLARELVQCTLPHRDPGDITVWVRRNGDYSLGLQPGADLKTGKSYGLPYGPLPRLLMLWIVTEAVRTKSKNIILGRSLNDFLRDIGLDPKTGGGKRGDATRLKEQMTRLFRCRISFEYEGGGRHSWLDMQVAPKGEFWWDYKSPDQPGIFESHIELSEDFFKAITNSPVPLDLRALLPLKKSPLAIDLYVWITYRVFALQQSKLKEVRIPLELLKDQFGSEYNRLDNFKAALLDALSKVQEVFPNLDYTLEKSHFILRDGKGDRAMPTREERPALAGARARELVNRISEKAEAWFHVNYPHLDIKVAVEDFDNWREKKQIPSANPDAHFKSFVKSWAKSAQ